MGVNISSLWSAVKKAATLIAVVAVTVKKICLHPRRTNMSKKQAHTESADQVIISISEVLQRASGEDIEAAAQAAGLKVKYVGDSMFEVYEE
jgi:hypothetical protein